MTLADPDQLTESKNLYNIGAGEVMWRNFLAGMSRALGSLVIYFLVLIVLSRIFVTFIWPTIEPAFLMLGETNSIMQQLEFGRQPSIVR